MRASKLTMQKLLRTCLVAVVLIFTGGTALAQGGQSNAPITYEREGPSAAAITFDLALMRPISLASTVLGGGIFLLTLPFHVIQGEPPTESLKTLVGKPAEMTFFRPLGQLE